MIRTEGSQRYTLRGVAKLLAAGTLIFADPQMLALLLILTAIIGVVALWPQEIYPGQFKPSLCHRFIKQLESNGQLLKNYSQNIDTLEQVAGITRVIQCHG